MTMTTLLRKCPVCNTDRSWLEEALREEYVFETWEGEPNHGTFFRSENHQAAINILNKCKRCHRDLRGLIRK